MKELAEVNSAFSEKTRKKCMIIAIALANLHQPRSAYTDISVFFNLFNPEGTGLFR
jgi:hypothetical protein